MNWSLQKANLTWPAFVWALLPGGLVVVGGAIGGLCGGVAATVNLGLMRSKLRAWTRYVLTGAVSTAAIASYFIFAKMFVTFGGLGGMTADRLQQELRHSPFYAALEKADPGKAEKMRAAIMDAVKSGKSQDDITVMVHADIVGLRTKYVPEASDQAIVEFARVMTLEIDQIGAKNAEACYDYLYPRPNTPPVDPTRFISSELAQREVTAIDAVVESAIADPRPVPDRPAIAVALNGVVRQLVANFGADDVATLGKQGALDHAKACAMVSAIYKGALVLPPGDRVLLLRFLFAENRST